MPINKTDVEKIAELAKLELTSEEAGAFTGQLGAILDHIEKLNELDISDVEPMSHCSPTGEDAEYVRRDDIVKPSLGSKLATENAPDTEAGYFKVPKVIGG